MTAVWNLYRFDYIRFVEIRPYLRTAAEPADFAALSQGAETDAIVEAVIEGDLNAISARHAFLLACCCVGQPLPCPRRFPRILKQLRQDIHTEAGTDLLSDAMAGRRNLETWLQPRGEVLGLLTPAETSDVLAAYLMAESAHRLSRARGGRRLRRGGLLNAFATFFRRLFDRGLAADEVFRLLGDLLETAVANGEGIAVIAV